MSYSAEVMEHFRNPRRVGALPSPDGSWRGENPVCGDVAEFTLEVRDDRVTAVRFKVSGCVATIAAASCLGELVEGRSLSEALSVDVERLVGTLGGLPASKKHGASLAIEVFRRALQKAVDGRSGAP